MIQKVGLTKCLENEIPYFIVQSPPPSNVRKATFDRRSIKYVKP